MESAGIVQNRTGQIDEVLVDGTALNGFSDNKGQALDSFLKPKAVRIIYRTGGAGSDSKHLALRVDGCQDSVVRT